MERGFHLEMKTWKLIAFTAVFAVAAILLWRFIAPVVRLAVGGGVIAFLFDPLSERFAARMKRPLAAALAILLVLGSFGGVLFVMAPYIVRQGTALMEAIPGSVEAIRGMLYRFAQWLREKGIPIGVQAASVDWNAIAQSLTGALGNAVGFFGGIASGISSFALMIVMAYFFLSDKEQLLLRLEMLVPMKNRKLAVKMAGAVKRELMLYLRGQFMISLIVSAVTGAVLMLIGIPSALLLGLLVGFLNLIPYFGPLLGGIPAVMLAFGGGMQKALITAGALIAIQQFDNAYISPRIMGDLTGVSPVAVLFAITLGNSVAGIGGMLFALPILLILRISLRVWAQRHETN